MSKMSVLNEDMLFSIECPACFEYLRAPVYVCVVGHSICNKCWSDLNTCPTCSENLSDTRNYTLESVAEMLYYPCSNSDYGCKENLKLGEIESHLTTCSYRLYHCKVQDCGWEGRRVQLEDHYLNAHGGSVIMGPENLCWWKDTKDDLKLMIAHKELFYVHRKIVDNYIYWVVQYIGKSEDVIQYYFQIRIFSDQYNNREISICENCQEDVKDISEIIESGMTAGVPLPVLETYKNERGHVWYQIFIKKT